MILPFLLARTIAERQGVADPNRIGIVGAVLRPPVLGIVVASALASREAQSSAAAVVVPTGPQVEVPDVKGDTLVDAEAQLKALGLQVIRQDLISDSTVKGKVVQQSPDPQSTTPAGSAVTLGVSIGFKMPDVKKQQQADAEAKLVGLGLGVTVVIQSDESDDGTVIGQDPLPGLFVSTGDA